MNKAIERFEKKIIKTGDCWFWTASKTKQGYGMFSYEGKSIPAHRFAYLAYNGEIGDKIATIHIVLILNISISQLKVKPEVSSMF